MMSAAVAGLRSIRPTRSYTNTRDVTESRMAEALAAHLAHLRESGRPVPDPHTDAGRIAA
jgi:hypothetical protein